MFKSPLTWLTLAVAVLVGALHADEPAAADATAAKVSFYSDVRPIVQMQCQGCHQPAKPSGGYVVTSFEALLKGGESEEAAIVAGRPEDSALMSKITPDDAGDAEMPKERPALAESDRALIEQWIREGAIDDTPSSLGPVVDGAHPPQYRLPPVVTALEFSPDGSLLAVSGYHEVLLHSADGSQLVARLVGLSERIQSLAFSPDGKLLAVTGGSPARFGEVQIWDVATRQLAQSVQVTFDTVYGASWSNDGTKIAFGCSDNTVRAIDAATGEQVLFQGAHEDWVLDTVFSTDSSHLISVSRDRSMKLTEVATERFVDNITSITPGALKGGLMSVDRHPSEDHLLVGGADGKPKLYQTYRTQDRKIGDDFNLIRTFDPMPGRIFSVTFNHDGSRIAAGSSEDGRGEVRVYQTENAKLVARCEGSFGPVYCVDFRPDGQVVAAGGFDGVVRLYDTESGKRVGEFVAVPISDGAVAAAEPAAGATANVEAPNE